MPTDPPRLYKDEVVEAIEYCTRRNGTIGWVEDFVERPARRVLIRWYDGKKSWHNRREVRLVPHQ
jgi:hypothetical protein